MKTEAHMCVCSQFLEADNLPDLTREYMYTLQSVHQLTATVWQIKQIRSQVFIFFISMTLNLLHKCYP